MPETVFFLSDYGLEDEFVGVVHAVLHRLAPAAAVLDLTHRIPPFDVRAGAAALHRALPHLGSGVVLAVVDPGVGSPRRGIALEMVEAGRTFYFVGPDNGLLPGALGAGPGPVQAVELVRPATAAATFDGRDLFAPAAAALCTGSALADLGPAVAPADLVRIPGSFWSVARVGSRRGLRAEITWVDRFGNVQLAVPGPEAMAAIGAEKVALEVERRPGEEPATAPAGPRFEGVRLVRAFSDLEPGELGLVVDANGQLAVVANRASAAGRLGVAAGGLLSLAW